ncbi:MAG: hypothetical protein GC158_16970 [Cyanobacteria bacterium RI_101]|nr:hypothetical protein [Cyanobacteria bacterium RI_101]
MRKIYAIGVGGSGAKCLEAIVFLHALGIYGPDCQLGILLVDADASNGNSQRASINLTSAIEAHQKFKNGKTSLLNGEIVNYGTWNPLGDVLHASDLETIFNKQSLQTATMLPLGKLFDALYSPEEQAADLKVGFRGRPPIGSIVMSRLELETLISGAERSAWQRLFSNVQTDLGDGNNQVVIHFCGSIFGGTGASGIPTLAKLVANQLQHENLRNSVRINASLLLPYFGFEKPNDGDQTVYAETRFFALNTQAALQYLTEQADGSFDRVYLIGDQDKKQYKSHTGGKNQQNDAHFVELYAALALNHAFEKFGPGGEPTKGLYISRTSGDGLLWDDLPDSQQIKQDLGKGVKFAYAWFYNFSLELEEAVKLGGSRFVKGSPWFRNFFSLKNGQDEKPLVSADAEKELNKTLAVWSARFLRWAQQIAASHKGGDQFFQLASLNEFDPEKPRSYHEHLHALVVGQDTSPQTVYANSLDTIKNQLTDQRPTGQLGVFGLAHALFDLL